MKASEIFELLKPDIDGRIDRAVSRINLSITSTATSGSGVSSTIVQTMIDASIATHVAASNPHPVYLTQTEGDALYASVSTTIIGTGALTGGGALGSNQTISMNTPGSLSVSSTNSASTNHTHVITASSDVSAGTSALLKSASGALTLASLTTSGVISGAINTDTAHKFGYATIGYVGYSSYAGFATNAFASAGNYALLQNNVTGAVILNAPTGQTISHRINNATIMSMDVAGLKVESAKKVYSNGYAPGWAGSGWSVDQNITFASQSFAEFDNLSIRGTMSVYELIINQIRATNGTLLVTSAGKISAIAGSIWTLEDPESSSAGSFAANDLVIIQNVDVNASTVIKRIVRRVTSISTNTITVTAAAGGPVDVGSPAIGDAVVRFGNSTNTSRQGSIILTSDFANSPFIDIVNGVSAWSEWADSSKTKARIGLLTGITAVSGEYGIIAGNGFAATNAYIRMSSSGIFVNNAGATWSTSGTNFLTIDNTDGVKIIANTAYTSSRAFKFSDGSSEIGGLYMYTQVSGRGLSLATQPTSKASLLEIRSEANASQTAQLLLEAKQSANLSRISLDIASGGTRTITYTTTTHSIVSSAETGSVDIKSGGLTASIDISDYVATASATQVRIGTISIAATPNAIIVLEANGGEPFYLRATTSTFDFGYNGNSAFSINTSANVSFTNNISVIGSATFNYITNPLYIHTTDVTINNNVSMLTGTYGVSSSISLASASWGYSSHIAFNAYYTDASINYISANAWRYWGAQYTGNVTAPGLFSFDANSSKFRFNVGETGLAYDAYITTWTELMFLDRTSFSINVPGDIKQSSTTGAIAPLSLTQSDLSEEMIDFKTSVGAGNPVDTAAVGTAYGKLRIAINGTYKYIQLYNT